VSIKTVSRVFNEEPNVREETRPEDLEAGAAVLLISEDLDELLELSDRIAVMFDGRLVHQTTAELADIGLIGRCMAGHGVELTA